MDEQMSRWGNPRDNQIKASYTGYVDEVVKYKNWRGMEKTRIQKNHQCLSTEKGDQIDDDFDGAEREFSHKCGLVQMVLLMAESAKMVLIFDGYSQEQLPCGRVYLNINPADEELKEQPVASIRFKGRGPRYGRLYAYEVISVKLWFSSRAQIKEYLTIAVPSPKPKTVKETKIVHQDDDSIVPFLAGAAVGAMIASD